MRLCVMLLDMLKLRRLFECGNIPIQMSQPLMNRGIPRTNIPQICLEMLDIDGVKPDDCRVEPNIRLGDGVTEVVDLALFLSLGQMGFDAVQSGEEGDDGFLVCFLRGCEAGFVDAIVDVVVDPFVGGLDVAAEGWGEEVDIAVFGGDKVVKFVVEHANDFGTLYISRILALKK